MSLDLRSGQSHWLVANAPLPPFPEPVRNTRADVVVVGAGISGALAAAVLAEAGVGVVVLDRRRPAGGSTSANTALISYEPDLSLAQIARRRGWETAVHAYHAARRANEELGELIRRLDIRCDHERAQSFHIARTAAQARRLREEHRLRIEAGLRCAFVGGDALRREYGLVATGALRTPEAAQLDPVRCTGGLLDYAVDRGARCYHADVSRIEPAAHGCVVRSRSGPRVTARYVVCATGYEAQLRLRQRTVTLTSTYVIAARVPAALPAWLRTSILWDMGRPYFYARSAGNRILVGGGDEPFVDEITRDAMMPRKARHLARYLDTILPGLGAAVSSVWCGTFARTADSLPCIGERDGLPGVIFSLGYGGNGITGAMLGALHARAIVMGRRVRGSAVFAIDRAPGGSHRENHVVVNSARPD